MADPFDAPMTQAEFGARVGVSQAAISELVARGTLSPGAAGGVWLREYCSNLREQAAGRWAAGDLDLAAERARLAKEQADRIALQNERTRRESAPTLVIHEVLARTAAKINVVFEGLPGSLRRRFPELSAETIDYVSREIARVRNIVAEMPIDDVISDDGGEGDGGRGGKQMDFIRIDDAPACSSSYGLCD